jgi:hypothetical protein
LSWFQKFSIPLGIDDRIRNDLPPDDRKERVLADIGDHHGGDLAAALEDAEDGDLAGCAAPAFAFANAAKIAFVPFVPIGKRS